VLPWGSDEERKRSERIAQELDRAEVPPREPLDPFVMALLARKPHTFHAGQSLGFPDHAHRRIDIPFEYLYRTECIHAHRQNRLAGIGDRVRMLDEIHDIAAEGCLIERAGEEAEIIVSSGGVSAGEADFLPRLVAEIGKVVFWKVRIRPGMPFLFGEIGKAMMFALPGNPVSGIATFLTLVKPALEVMTGVAERRTPLRARLRHAIYKHHARTEFQRARLDCDGEGALWATPLEQQGSGMLRSVAEADALMVLSEATHEFAAGAVVDLLPLPGWPV